MAKGETTCCGTGPTTCAEHPDNLDVSTVSTWMSKLMTLLNDSAELATDMCEHAKGGHGRTGMLGWSSVMTVVS